VSPPRCVLCWHATRDAELRLRAVAQVRVDFSVVPLVGVVVLLVVGAIGFDVVRAGVIGDSAIRPLALITLFLSLAYVSVAVDKTGVFEALALAAARRAHSARSLFFIFFAFSSAMTTVTSNDIVILGLTPIVFHCCRSAGVDPLPSLYAQFFAANMWSALLYTGAVLWTRCPALCRH
jgi:Na+/H+ antiporter NhaD/arsenite permease-like protein